MRGVACREKPVDEEMWPSFSPKNEAAADACAGFWWIFFRGRTFPNVIWRTRRDVLERAESYRR